MSKKFKPLLVCLSGTLLFGISCFAVKPAIADSPLTSTDLAAAYEDLLEVRVARRWKRAEGFVLDFLLGESPLDQKLAVVNALGWNVDNQTNSVLFVRGIAQRENLALEKVTVKDMTADDRVVLGYLMAMDNYFDMPPLTQLTDSSTQLSPTFQRTYPEDLLSFAIAEDPSNFSAQFIASLVEAQRSFPRSWCDVYLETAWVLDRFPVESRNMRPAAVDKAMEYMNLYQSYCDPER